jgi:hypothetical protein
MVASTALGRSCQVTRQPIRLSHVAPALHIDVPTMTSLVLTAGLVYIHAVPASVQSMHMACTGQIKVV